MEDDGAGISFLLSPPCGCLRTPSLSLVRSHKTHLPAAVALVPPTIRTLNIWDEQNCVVTNPPRDKPMKKRTTMRPAPLVTNTMQNTAGDSSSMKAGIARRGPNVSHIHPMMKRLTMDPVTCVRQRVGAYINKLGAGPRGSWLPGSRRPLLERSWAAGTMRVVVRVG